MANVLTVLCRAAMTAGLPPPDPPSLADKVAFLSGRDAYPYAPATVRVLETHMSWLFLTGTLVYKLKKPVRYPFLDFSTLGRRRHYCAAEVRLNKRLAGSAYRRVVPLTSDDGGHLAIDGGGRTIEWLVEMDELPEAGLLHNALHAGEDVRERLIAVIEMLGAFYARARRQRRDGYLYLRHLRVESAVNRRLLLSPASGLPAERTAPLLDRVEALFHRLSPTIEARIRHGCIVEGHGDLRPEHVFLGPPPLVIDCLEFDRSMRLLDPWDEVNYLGMECGLLGAEWVGPLALDVLDRYFDRRPEPRLLAFYGAFRSMLRARICIAHLLDPDPADPARWPRKAGRYLDLAERYCAMAEAG